MICKCNTEMNCLVNDYDGNENYIGSFNNCPKCGRIYYEGKWRGQDKGYWIEPEYLQKEPLNFLKVDIC